MPGSCLLHLQGMRSPFVVLLTSFSVVFSFSPRFSTSVSILFRQSLRLLWKFTLPFRIFRCLVTSSVKSSCRLLLSLTIRLALQTQPQQCGDAGAFQVSKNHRWGGFAKYPQGGEGCRIPCWWRVQNTPKGGKGAEYPAGGGCKLPCGGECRIPCWRRVQNTPNGEGGGGGGIPCGGMVQNTMLGEGAKYPAGGECKIPRGGGGRVRNTLLGMVQNTLLGEGAEYPVGEGAEYPVGGGCRIPCWGGCRIPCWGRVQNTLLGRGCRIPVGGGCKIPLGQNTLLGEGEKYPMGGGRWIPWGRVEYPVEKEGAEYFRGGVRRISYAGRVQNTLRVQGAEYPAEEAADLSRGSYSEHLESRQ